MTWHAATRGDSPRRRYALACLLVAAMALWPGRAHAADAVFGGIGFDETLTGDVILAEAMRALGSALSGITLNVRLVVDRGDVERATGEFDFTALDARIAAYRGATDVRVYLDLRGATAAPEAQAAWGRFARAVATRYRGVVRGYVFGVRPDATGPSAREVAFFLKTTAVNIRAGDGAAATIVGGLRDADAAWLADFYLEDGAPYVDAVGLEAGSAHAAVLALVDQHDPSAAAVLFGEPLGSDPAAGASRMLDHYLGVLGTRSTGATYVASRAVVAAALAPLPALRGLLEQELVTLDETTVGLRLTRAGADVTGATRHRLLFGLGSTSNYLLYAAGEGPLELVMSEPSGSRPVIVDAIRGTRRPAGSFTWDATTRVARLELPASSQMLVVDWSTGGGTSYSAREDVSSTALPSVSEIIARHQQAQTVQDGLLRSYVARANMDQHFRTTSVDPGFDVITENRLFVEEGRMEWQELSFSLNGTKWGPNRPAFPLLQAEKVLSLPLDLRLDSDYRYSLVGVETVEGRSCFALRFDPVDEARSLYRGTVWIDRETYRRVKAQTVQTRLVSPVLSSEEIHYFTSAGTLDGQDIQLLTRLVGRQIMLIAGRNLMVERGVRFEAFQLNPTDFETQREAARASDSIMYRDTDEGLRYFMKKDGVRVIQEATTRATAGLLGVTYDPAYDFPLPLVGVNYLDFNFLGQDNQLAVIFGGVLALVNVQRAKLVGSRVDGSLDLFAIAVTSNDRAYDGGGEVAGQRVNTRPFSTGVNLGWQLAQFQKVVASYQFRYDAYSADDTTADTFRVPSSTATSGLGLAFEWKQAGFSFLVGGTSYRRAQWTPWGASDDYRPTDKTYLKYSASLTKDFFFGFHKIHLNTAYYGGRRLDRFSAYQFGFFDDNRVHGVPSAGVRFGELGMVRGSYSLNLFDQYRLEVFLDQAVGRDPRRSTEWQAVTGVGLGGNLRGPYGTLIRGDLGKSFLPSRYRRPGSLVLQIQLLKPF